MFPRVAFWFALILLSACTLDDLRDNAENQDDDEETGDTVDVGGSVKAFDDCPISSSGIEGCWRSPCTAVDIRRDGVETTVWRQGVAKFQDDNEIKFQRWEFENSNCDLAPAAARISAPTVVFTDNGTTFEGGDSAIYNELELSYQYPQEASLTTTVLYRILSPIDSGTGEEQLCLSENFRVRPDQVAITPAKFSAGYTLPTGPCLTPDL